MKILIVDDDRELTKGIALYLSKQESDDIVETAADWAEAVSAMERGLPDVVVLDVLLPDGSGYEICREIKERGDIPVIFLSCLGETEDRIRGLLSGGDDYMGKPFSLPELELRIKARAREKEKRIPSAGVDYQFGEVEVKNQRLCGGRKEVLLTETEYRMLLLLARNEGRTVTLEEIYEAVWGGNYMGDLRTVQSHIANLRRKLAEAYETKEHIRTKWGEGYIFRR